MDHTTITTEIGTRVSVDAYENWESPKAPDNIWLNIAVPMASASVVLNPAQARELAATLIAFAEAA
jgi:hypothetical protein